ncbi:MAG: hypothetical protein WDZ29_06140 [Balneolaceae bacterium]
MSSIPKILFIPVFALILWIRCTPQPAAPDIEVEALPIDEDQTLHATVFTFDEEVDLINPTFLRIVNEEYLVVLDGRDENLFKVFRLPDLEFLYSWGRMGPGPDEFQSLSSQKFEAIGDTVILRSAFPAKLSYYTVTDTAFVLVDERTIPEMNMQIAYPSLTRIHDSLFVASYGLFEQTEFEYAAIVPGLDEIQYNFGKYPETHLEGREKFEKYLKMFVGKPDGSRIMAFYYGYDQLKLFQSSGEPIRWVQISDPYHDLVDGEARFRGFGDASGEYIFILGFHLTNSAEVTMDDLDSIRFSLEVWDWEGQPVHRVMLDRQAMVFAISERYGMLYGFSLDDNSEIYRFDISHLFGDHQQAES